MHSKTQEGYKIKLSVIISKYGAEEEGSLHFKVTLSWAIWIFSQHVLHHTVFVTPFIINPPPAIKGLKHTIDTLS